jgi:hypothetical protein
VKCVSAGGKGGAEGIRTPDPLTASQVRYQLRHSPLPGRSYTTSRGPCEGGRRRGTLHLRSPRAACWHRTSRVRRRAEGLPDGRLIAFVVARADLERSPLPQRCLARGGRRVVAAVPAHGWRARRPATGLVTGRATAGFHQQPLGGERHQHAARGAHRGPGQDTHDLRTTGGHREAGVSPAARASRSPRASGPVATPTATTGAPGRRGASTGCSPASTARAGRSTGRTACS